MVVVADTSPINYLILIGQIDVLPMLYRRILIPPAVLAELSHRLAPKPVREWAADAPAWLEIVGPKIALVLPKLDRGETEAIALATEVHTNAVAHRRTSGEAGSASPRIKDRGHAFHS